MKEVFENIYFIILLNIYPSIYLFNFITSLLLLQFDGSHVESVLGLWLSINLELAGGKYAPSVAPTVHLTPRAISALLAAVVR